MDVRQTDPHTLEIEGKPISFEQRIKRFIVLPDQVIILLKVSDFEMGAPW